MPDRDLLRSLLHRKAREISEAAQNDGEVSAGQLETLNRLARVMEVRDKTIPAPPRWRISALLAGTLVLVSLLLFLHVKETEVELQVVASEVGFALAQPQVLTDVVSLADLGASGLRDIHCSDPALSQWIGAAAQDDLKAIRITTLERDGKSGSITVNPFILPAGLDIHIFEDRKPAACRILLKNSHTSVRATIYGPVRIDLQSAGTQSPVLDIPRSLLLDPAPEVNLNLRFAAGSEAAFSPQLSVRNLALSRIDDFQSLEGSTAHVVSTILSGTLYLESLNGEPRKLRPRELLQFDEVRGVIRTLQLEGGHVTLAFRGTVRGMRSGWGENPANLMPTWLAWLHARHGLSLLWGATLYVFGLLVAILRWWKVPV